MSKSLAGAASTHADEESKSDSRLVFRAVTDEYDVRHEFYSRSEYDAYESIDQARDQMGEEITDAARAGDLSALKSLLAEKHDAINAGDPNYTVRYFSDHCEGALALTLISGKGDKIGAIKMLLAEEALNPENHHISYDFDATYAAISSNDPKKLIAAVSGNPAYLNINNKYGFATITFIMQSPNPEMINSILPLLDINIVSFHHVTLLDIAAALGQIHIIETLLRDDRLEVKNPITTVRSSMLGSTPLETLNVLIKDERFDLTKFNGRATPLNYIIKSEMVEVLDFAIGKLQEVSSEVAKGALIAAIESKNPVEKLQKLLSDKRFIEVLNNADDNKPSVLVKAFNMNPINTEVINLLKKYGAICGMMTESTLSSAICSANIGFVLEHFSNSIDINAPIFVDNILSTIFKQICKEPVSSVEFPKYLKLLEAILKRDDLKISAELAKQVIMQSSVIKDFNLVLLESVLSYPKIKSHINLFSDGEYISPILKHILESNCSPDVVKLLEKNGAKVNLTPENLFSAIDQGSVRLMSKYLEHAPDMVNAVDINGISALSHAIRAVSTAKSSQASLAVLEIVLAHPNLEVTAIVLDNAKDIEVIVSLLESNYMLAPKIPFNFVDRAGVNLEYTSPTTEKVYNAEVANKLAEANASNHGVFSFNVTQSTNLLSVVNILLAEFCGATPCKPIILDEHDSPSSSAASCSAAASDEVTKLGDTAGLD